MDDRQLRLIITDELGFEPGVDASHINKSRVEHVGAK